MRHTWQLYAVASCRVKFRVRQKICYGKTCSGLYRHASMARYLNLIGIINLQRLAPKLLLL